MGTSESSKKKGIGKAAVLVVFIVAMVVLYRFTPLKDIITKENIELFINSLGPWGPVIFILIYFIGICLFLPGTLFTAIGGAVYDTFPGTFYNIIGAMLGASASFVIGRYLGREFAASLIGNRLKKYDDKIAEKGFATILYLRLIYFPFTPLNFGMGLTKITFKDYFFGTLFGIIAGTFVLTFFASEVKEVLAGGDVMRLFEWKPLLSLALFVASFFIPVVVKKFRPPEEMRDDA